MNPDHGSDAFVDKPVTHHFIDLGGVKLLNVSEDPNIIVPHKIDSDTLTPISARPADAVDVELTGIGQVIVDHQGNLHLRT